jgi:hypothetical protein
MANDALGFGREGMVDLAAVDVVVRECATCDAPVFGTPHAGVAELVCGACGAVDAVPSSRGRRPPASADAPGPTAYRGRLRAKDGKLLPVDLAERPPGFERVRTVAALEAEWRREKRAHSERENATGDDDRIAREHRLVWLATTLAAERWKKRDALRARAVLETALSQLTAAPYRAIVLARLARLACLSKGVALARLWLSELPPGKLPPEVVTDVCVAEAFVAREEGGEAAVLERLGDGSAADAFAGPARHLAAALRIDALEKLGRRRDATAAFQDAARAGGVALGQAAAAYGLARLTRKRAVVRGVIASITLALTLASAYAAIAALLAGDGHVLPPFLVLFACLAVAFILRGSRLSRRGSRGRVRPGF